MSPSAKPPQGPSFAIKMLATHAVLACENAENVPSPCRSVCRMDAQNALCEGCFRTLEEIATWSSASPTERQAVWTHIRQRLGQAYPELRRWGGLSSEDAPTLASIQAIIAQLSFAGAPKPKPKPPSDPAARREED